MGKVRRLPRSRCRTRMRRPQQLAGIAKDNSRHFGDDPDDAGPIATDLSASLDPAAVGKAMRKVGDWQMARSEQYFDRIWTWSVLYSGFMAASDSLGDTKYRDAMEAMGKKFDWQLRSHLPDADDQSVGQTYLELYLLKKDPAMIAADADGAGCAVAGAARFKEAWKVGCLVVVRCAVHGAAGVGEDVRGDGRQEVHRLSR